VKRDLLPWKDLNEHLSEVMNLKYGTIGMNGTIETLLKKGIAAKPGIMNSHQEEPYAGQHKLPESEKARQDAILLPLFDQLEHKDVKYILDTLRLC